MIKSKQGIWSEMEYAITHNKAKVKKMLKLGYDAYGYGGFHCKNCGSHSPMPHKKECNNIV